MSNQIKITYVNRSMNEDLPKIFLFLKNEIPTFDALKDGLARHPRRGPRLPVYGDLSHRNRGQRLLE